MALWGGRFSGDLDALAAEFNASLPFDRRLGEADVHGSVAWARALARANVIATDEADQLCGGLEQILGEMQSGKFEYADSDEDIHTAVERRLGEIVGDVAGKLHTGRSRNDQVATDFRMWLMEALDQIDRRLHDLQSTLVSRAESDAGIMLPGYTHFQRAQPVLLSHWWLSHFWPLARDRKRLAQVYRRTSVLPLGSAALAGTSFGVDREALKNDLGFESISANSLDAVSDRDFAAEFLFVAAMLGVHLSRLSEALILYSTAEFGFIELADEYSTGSSLMPQKKNPDMLELTRGKSGRLIGHLTGLLTTLKALPSAYDKDLQEDKPPVFDAVDTLLKVIPVVSGVISTLSVKADRIQAALDPVMLATDLADYLVERGVPFRTAHAIVGRAVRRAIDLGLTLDRLPLSELKTIAPIFDEAVARVFDFEAAIARRNVAGGTGSQAVQAQLAQAKEYLKSQFVEPTLSGGK